MYRESINWDFLTFDFEIVNIETLVKNMCRYPPLILNRLSAIYLKQFQRFSSAHSVFGFQILQKTHGDVDCSGFSTPIHAPRTTHAKKVNYRVVSARTILNDEFHNGEENYSVLM